MKLKSVLLFVCFLVAAVVSNSAIAQNTTNYANVKVDELSDAQVRQLMQRAESIGYNDAQLGQMAQAQGMQAEEVRKLQARVEKLRQLDSGAPGSAQDSLVARPSSIEVSRGRTYQIDSAGLRRPINTEEALFGDLKSKIFGAELFKNGNITFEPNLRLATPRNYVIGPDDQLLIDLSGDNEASYNLKVSPEGIIRLQYVGNITVGGLTIEQASSKIRSAMAGTYPSLRSGRTSVAINLGNIRSIKVILNGQVTKPGTYTLSSLSSVFNALYASGGPNENGSFRKIQVIRGGRVVSTVDVYDFLINGMQRANVRLQDQDVINIPVYDTRVEIVGEVKRPAIYESVAGESFQDILNYAGGFSTAAYKAKVKVFQNTDKERKITDIQAEDFRTYLPKSGDKYFVEPILDRFENRVEIQGAVFRPGFFELEKGLTLSALIAKAEGLKEDAFQNRGYINRLNPDNTPALISFDVAKIMSGADQDIVLQREDKVTISSIFDLREEYNVQVQGEVRQPGTFDFAEGMKLGDAIQMAGGFKEGASPNRVEISRRVKNSNASDLSARTATILTVNITPDLKIESDSGFVLEPFDIVSIRSAEGYVVQKQVKLEGEVLYPGIYTIQRKDERISDLIKRAGGLTPLAYTDGASLKRPSTKAVNSNDKNAINNQEEEQKKLLNLRRLKEAGAKDSSDVTREQLLIESDLVGINLTRILDNPGTRIDLLMEDGDIIRVPKQLQTVKVTGEVLNPNNIVYAPGKSFKGYVNGAGGFASNALRNGAYIRYANGSVESARKFLFFNNYPKVKPGAEILVPKRAERERLTAQSWIGIGTAVASLGAIIVSLLR
ncbi:capsule biosynthesis protein [Pedobacter yulinensis]|uniref:Capsule biosynthesis protein n=1 Tax=Pedobacter yulinensis TaxID=2126353 RepID=A0A2T3HNM2_9SPHI|nr:SLBB domain-containing protein [Pedobacter yulinensis]PST84050.1 capsule biosynthesis protein [Pedobacter yulinensis]